MIKLHKFFLNGGHADSLDEKLPPRPDQRAVLSDAKNAIRDRLRERIRRASVTVLGSPHMVEPRFRTQGSWAYRTCVQQAHVPPQEMDWDFGVYLPVAVWEDNGTPKVMAKKYFELVETILAELCREQGWTLIRDKDTCARVQVADWAHIDVPLYAASEEEFREVTERAIAKTDFSTSLRESAGLNESFEKGELVGIQWEDMEGIFLACRDGTWRESDPEAVAKWFADRVADHGDQLRRVCCYMKSWRDYQWRDGGGPSSVALMIAIARDFQAKPRRDDLALEHAANSVAQAIAEDLKEPVLGTDDFNNLDAAKRRSASALAGDLARKLRLARGFSKALHQDAIDELIRQFGPRIANDPNFVEADDGADVVRATAASVVVAPTVNATKAG